MPWTLEIHHIDVAQGDATLIIARRIGGGLPPIIRSVLIDGGKGPKGPDVHAYITATAGLANLDVMVATHYDADHVGGLSNLLINYPGTYDNTIIYDQGWPIGNEPIAYIRSINGRNSNGHIPPVLAGVALNRRRPTSHVINHPIGGAPYAIPAALVVLGPPAFPPPGIAIGGAAGPPNWLVGKEIMWTDGRGYPNPALYGGAAIVAGLPAVPPVGNIPWPAGAGVPAPSAPGGPPSIKCITANQEILQAAGGTVNIVGGMLTPDREKNQKSIAFIIEFNRFRYYIGGDIESAQEDGLGAPNGIMHYINPGNIPAGRVHAMKMSHHGSGFSSSANFINRLRPSAGIISCGANNDFGLNPPLSPPGHPQQIVINSLTASFTTQNIYLTNDRHDNDFCARLNAPLFAPFLPGSGHYSPITITAGGWGLIGGAAPPAPSPCGGVWPNDGAPGHIFGNIRIDVTEVQSNYVGGALVGAAGAANFTVTYNHPLGAQVVAH